MATKITLDPVTRLEGHLKIEVTVDAVGGEQQVVDARATGTLFRGFEQILQNRDPQDAPDLTQRICGVCPVAHGTAASLTLEACAKTLIPENARLMRNLVLGANYVQSHILHFYHLALLDYVVGPADMPPWTPTWTAGKDRFSPTEAALLTGNYVKALEYRRLAHEAAAIFGGRLPHPPTFVAGGFTTTPRAARITKFRSLAAELKAFVRDVYIPDCELLTSRYWQYFDIGKGYGNLLSYGVFDEDPGGNVKLLARGRVVSGQGGVQSVDVKAITEAVTYSWYKDTRQALNPANGVTQPVYPKQNAYSWLKSPRYSAKPYEVGPLARMTVNRDYTRGISVNDRQLARAQEALKVAEALDRWAGQLTPSGPVYQQFVTPTSASGYGLTEAPRGALGHWASLSAGKIARYQVITPTCWNASPKDSAGARGPLEQALVGTPVGNLAEPVEVLRVIHSFDPCLSCAVHVARPKEGVRIFALGHAG